MSYMCRKDQLEEGSVLLKHGHSDMSPFVWEFFWDNQREVVVAQKAIKHWKQDPAYYGSFTAPKCWIKDSVVQSVTDSVAQKVSALESRMDVYLSVDFR